MLDYWLHEGCTTHGFIRAKADARVEKRHAFLEKYATENLDNPLIVYPFVHGLLHIGNLSWYHPSTWGLDPLVVPILKHMNALNGVETYSSCQGSDKRSPSIAFSTTEDGALSVLHMIYEWHRQIKEGWYWNEAVVALSDRHKGKTRYNLWFYDVLALIKFNKEYLQVPITEQIAVPKCASLRDRYGLMLSTEGLVKLGAVTAEEIEQVLDWRSK